MNARVVALCALLLPCTLLAPRASHASSTGMTGASRIGCGGASNCHGASSLSTSVRVEGPSSVVRGSMTTYELIITNSGLLQDTAGFDLATSAGALETDARATQTQAISNELTHRAPIAQSAGGTWRIPFRFIAPASGASATLTFAANATNANFSSRGDQWNTGTFAITVTDTMMVDAGLATPDASVTTDASADSSALADATADSSALADSGTPSGRDGAADSGEPPAPMMRAGCTIATRACSPRSARAAMLALLALAWIRGGRRAAAR